LDSLKEGSPTVDNFIVPIVTISNYTGEKLYNHIRRVRYKKYNDYLADLAKELEITDIKLTTYVSRHTMAMMLQRNDVAREQISQMLGHADMKTTNTYLDSFDTTVIDEAAKVLYSL
ncbi:MAG: tyrosine-type recombinase/integrase, partial [Firmicutes bacterium]|nr:tyrosine-type recombinase/integrase [Bacillota bacterium]